MLHAFRQPRLISNLIVFRPPASRRARATPPADSASAFADIGQRRGLTGHFFRIVAGQLHVNGQLLRFIVTLNRK